MQTSLMRLGSRGRSTENVPGLRVPPTLRAMFWRVANCARKRARGKESRAVPVPVLDLSSASLRIGALFTFELVFIFMLVYALGGVLRWCI